MYYVVGGRRVSAAPIPSKVVNNIDPSSTRLSNNVLLCNMHTRPVDGGSVSGGKLSCADPDYGCVLARLPMSPPPVITIAKSNPASEC